ncbi:TonB-dependent receptor, partial [Pseudoalteromonas sp. S1649]
SRGAVYGSVGLAGVINIITRKGQNTTFDVPFGADSYQEFQVASGGEFAGVYVAVNAGNEKTDGFDVLQGLDPDEDVYEN